MGRVEKGREAKKEGRKNVEQSDKNKKAEDQGTKAVTLEIENSDWKTVKKRAI